MTDYISVADADTWFGGRLYATDWTGATSADKTKAITMATNSIDRLPFRGEKYADDQDHQWPRYVPTPDRGVYLVDHDDAGNAVVPQFVADACCEEALEILRSGDSERRRMQREGVEEYRLSPDLREYYGGFDGALFGGLLSHEAYNLLKYYISRATKIL